MNFLSRHFSTFLTLTLFLFVSSTTLTSQCIVCPAQNLFSGFMSGAINAAGNYNNFYGNECGFSNVTGFDNSFYGAAAGYSNFDGGSNAYFGNNAGFSVANGSNNSFFGYNAGGGMEGSGNICIGANAGPTGFTTVQENNRLYIDNTTSNDPLIYGNFDTDHVIINGTFEVTAGLYNPSSEHLKNHFSDIEEASILDKIMTLPITEWSYKNQESVRHIGPTAQDFYSTFGLGMGEENISTIDTDGIALVAIKALKMENDQLRNELDKLSNLVLELTNNSKR